MFRSKLSLTRHKAIKPLVLVTSVLVLAVLITVSGHSVGSALSKHEVSRSASSAPFKADQDKRVEVEVITITPDGFEPQEIVRPAGPFLLAVTNRSGIDSLNLQLVTERRDKLREKSLPLETPRWREVINPPPGRYVITEANHPEWAFSLIIQ